MRREAVMSLIEMLSALFIKEREAVEGSTGGSIYEKSSESTPISSYASTRSGELGGA